MSRISVCIECIAVVGHPDPEELRLEPSTAR